MSRIFSDPIKPTEFNPVKENAHVARCDESCDDVMNVALIIFSSMAAVAFFSCLTAAAILSSAALGVAAGVIALIALTILMPGALMMRPAHSGYTEVYEAPPYHTLHHFNLAPEQPSTPRRGDVPQQSPSKVRSHQRVSSAPVARNDSRTATFHGRVVPGQDRNRR